MNSINQSDNRRLIRIFVIAGIVVGTFFALIEFLARKGREYPQALIPLLIRANVIALLIMTSIAYFEILVKDWSKQKKFFTLVLTRSIIYTFLITFVLAIVNGFWGIIDRGFTFTVGVIDYITDESYLVNLVTILVAVILMNAMRQINSLHRRGELIDFIIGKYHRPKEVNRIFCFIDLNGSTTIGERLGHYQFGLFLKDYYSDITDALRNTEAEIYQYVGDEIILFWPYKKGLYNNNCIRCFFKMKEIINGFKGKYLEKYGVIPEFKAGLHGGKVTITRVGELKKEIVFIGDVLNTTARLQESCKRLSKEFLISKDLLDLVDNPGEITASFMEETILRGKEKTIKIYSLDLAE